ncbi:T9SS type A sorting domain-containing protein [bacterium]|nr:T9SS type A sorting domain-containing protein [bacterium]
MKKILATFYILLILLPVVSVSAQVNGEIIEQDLNASRHGYSIVKLWGGHYEMGYAYGYLFAEDIIAGLNEGMEMIEDWGLSWSMVLMLVNTYTCKPDCIEDEFEGIADGVNDGVPGVGILPVDIKAMNLFGDIYYFGTACRAVSSWGSTVTNSEFTTISTRRLDYFDLGLDFQYHHVIAIFEPDDGSPNWINFAWPGYVSCLTALNEFGTVASLHDWGSGGSSPSRPLPRTLASRYALTMVSNPDISTHLSTVFSELNTYNCATPGFLNYFVPDGYGGVIKHHRTSGYYEIRYPNPGCYGGEAIYTNNSDISGTYIGDPWVSYYSGYAASGDITMEGQWETAGPSFHRMTVGFRGRNDMRIWFDGQLSAGHTSRVEFEWADLVGIDESQSAQIRDFEIHAYPNPFNSVCVIETPYRGAVEIFDIAGNLVWENAADGKRTTWVPSSETPGGIYLLRVTSNGKSIANKLVYLK